MSPANATPSSTSSVNPYAPSTTYTPSPTRQQGVVKWFSDAKGYGFIAPDGSATDIFVHFTGILGKGHRRLTDGDRVEFEVEVSDKGPQAINVSVPR